MSDSARLLVVEDDVHLLQGIRDILEYAGYTVFTAPSGADGLEMLNELQMPPDLIISDIMMPRMDGYQFFEAVRAKEQWLEIPFVFLTAKGEKHDVRLGKRLGADDYVIKPMDPEDLLIIIEAKLRRRQELRDVMDTEVSDVKHNILTILNHEMRTPLTYMVAYSDMLNTDAENLTANELRTYLQGVNNGADRFRRLVENFIMMVELETDEARQNYEWRSRPINDVLPICNEVLENTRVVAEEKNVTIALDIPAQVPAFIGDHEYLRSCLTQLVDNAIKFSATPGEIKQVALRVNSDAEHVIFAVQDWGRGIPEGEFEKIWLPFYQIDRSQFEDQGAGSGLTIVREIAKLHGGEITLESLPGEGSTFTLTIPLAKRQS